VPLSKIIHKTCPTCGKVAVEASRIDFGSSKLITLQCGHVITEDVITSANYSSIVSSDGRTLRDYQVKGIEFIEASNARTLIADEQGLGKTVQSLGALKLHPELLPALVVTKTTLKHQWFYVVIRWCGQENYLTQVINSSKEFALPGFQVYITSYDLLKNERLFSMLPSPPKTIIIDECQAIKNHLSQRAKAVQEVAKSAEHIIGLSGTPIKNNAGEYFTILNILQPTRFATYQGFLDTYCDHYWNGYGTKVGGLSDPELFSQQTSDFIIRRTRIEAAPELPIIDRQFYHVELNPKLNKAYAEASKELEDLLYKDEDEDTITSMITIMTKMRKITGISKVIECVDYVTTFLLDHTEDKKKLVVFAHHHDAINLLELKLNQWLKDGGYAPALNLHAGLNADARSAMVKKFKEDDTARVMIASTLAAGEGLNLQFCDIAIMLERQWNPANEEQAEGRFIRIGQTSNHVVMVYMIASETIDEYFTEIVEQKRAIVKGTLDKESVNWDQNSLLKELAGILVTKGKKAWRL